MYVLPYLKTERHFVRNIVIVFSTNKQLRTAIPLIVLKANETIQQELVTPQRKEAVKKIFQSDLT